MPTAAALIAVPLLPLVAAVAIATLRPTGDLAARWAIGASAVAAIAAILLLGAAAGGPVEAILESGDGQAIVGLIADRVTSVLALLTAGVGLVVQSFSRRALAGDPRAARFFALSSVLTAATASAALAATGSGFVLGWIVTGVSLSALVAHRAGWQPAERARRRVRRSFLLGDAALVLALVLAATGVGDLDLRTVEREAAMLAGADALIPGAGDALVVVAVLLVIAGMARSAVIPFHRWLPATLAGPTPTSALLHAGVVNGAGVLLVRFAPIFGTSPLATHLAFTLGAVTAVVATAVMLIRADVKGNLVWSTAGQMGFMVVQCAVGAFSAALFHLVGHGLYKAALFLGSGNAISAHLEHRRQQHTASRMGVALRRGVAFALPPAGLLLAYRIVDLDLDAAGDILVIVFAWATATRALRGWLDAAPLRTAATLATGAASVALTSLGYVAGLAAFKRFVEPALPATVSGAVSPTVLAATLAILTLGIAGFRLVPGRTGQTMRRRLYTQLLATSAPVPSGVRAPRRSRVRNLGGPTSRIPRRPETSRDRRDTRDGEEVRR